MRQECRSWRIRLVSYVAFKGYIRGVIFSFIAVIYSQIATYNNILNNMNDINNYTFDINCRIWNLKDFIAGIGL